MRHLCLGLSVALSLLAGAAAAQPCTFQSGALPTAITGQIVYEDYGGQGALYIYGFQWAGATANPSMVPIASWGLSNPTNPVFSPDGKAIVFSAIQTNVNERHIFYWVVGSEAPTNLTGAMKQTRNEDVKFSPNGHWMIWKQTTNATEGINLANFSLDANGNPSISNSQQLVAGQLSTPSEASAPTLSPDDQHVYYFIGSGNQRQIWRYDVNGATVSPAFSQSSGSYYYYPIVDYAHGELFYASGPADGRDKLFIFPDANQIGTPATATEWNACDANSDDSDPAPVTSDYFVFSRDNGVGSVDYQLYLGQLSTGDFWVLPASVNLPNTSLRGASYLAAPRSAPTAFDLGGASYRQNTGGGGRPDHCALKC